MDAHEAKDQAAGNSSEYPQLLNRPSPPAGSGNPGIALGPRRTLQLMRRNLKSRACVRFDTNIFVKACW